MRIVLGNGSLARYPQGGGHWTVFLQFLLGLEALGHDVVLWEEMEPRGVDADECARAFFDLLAQFGLERRAALVVRNDATVALDRAVVHGRTAAELRTIAGDADVLWNFCGAFREPLLSLFRRRVFIDLDPGHLHVAALDWDLDLAHHDCFFTVGLNMNAPDCEVPQLGFSWSTFPPVIYLPMWNMEPDPGIDAPFTSITHWDWAELYWNSRPLSLSKRQAYLGYVDLPRITRRRFQLAANIHPNDSTGDRETMLEHGWELVHPYDVAGSPGAYREFIRQSRAEILCPKPIYAALKTGWMSDRSACYLATGRPVLAQETGFSKHIPAGEGLLAFNDMQEAAAGVRDIDADYERHRRAARHIAEEYLDGSRTLPAMLAACGV
jgi:hypothetical protein